ncbi:RNA polymerase sigma factor (sigma-70 family) [Actinoalloteichus hoggarensis]|uniref:RNA polymerase sigma factor n=1 Tax=Actinoalloteichus hoggarensis TaxID=1470176 RepID=A0A221W5I2_9PSEU|nr:sigma-70 family RNA polymerase sigma factor [Actinoalloteichus hoggarensis]ASO20777.1 RNA polymerase sigma factor [Actinoalloteichus hoggarensis]MBB5920707.1 RNA polymerase sigma factor (sigma-70 family) [Actinoalloteichus hoggarensis]
MRPAARAALGAEIMSHWPALLRAARRIVDDPATAEDLAAEAVARTLRICLVEGQHIDHLRAYLCTAVRTIGVDHHRRDRHVAFVGDFRDDQHPLSAAADTALWERLVRAEEHENIARAYGELRTRWQDVLYRIDIEGDLLIDVATDLGMRPNSVAALLWRARRALRESYLA